MSFDHWWFGFILDEADYRRVKPAFDAAAKRAVLSPQATEALAAWRRRPSLIEEGSRRTPEDAELTNAFIWAFNLPGFDDFAAEFAMQDGSFGEYMTEERVFRFVSIPRHTPVSILWHVLGEERAELLPGRFGNMLLGPGAIDEALERVVSAFHGHSPEVLIERAIEYCGSSIFDEARLRDVIDFLPDALEQASRLGRGFLSLARGQL